MKKQTSTRRALLFSALALLLSVSMLVGSTFAWFTDSVTSANNKIVSGNLVMDLELLENDSFVSIKDSKKAIFDYENWEPGYTDVKVLRISNKGSLALKWIAKFVSLYQMTALGDVIDVYVNTSADEMPSSRDLDGYTYAGTVKEFVNTIEETTNGVLEAGQSAYLGIALKMREAAGNEYQNLSIGGPFDIQIFATQYTYEADSFGIDYDKDATFGVGPQAKVSGLNLSEIGNKDGTINATYGMGGAGTPIKTESAFRFETTETVDKAKEGDYKYWHADFVVSADKDIADGAIALLGYYEAYCKDYNNNNWVALTNDGTDISAGQEIRLLELLLNGGSISYQELCQWIPTFDCGVAALDESLRGTTITVELRLFEVTENTPNVSDETGDSLLVATYSYTF